MEAKDKSKAPELKELGKKLIFINALRRTAVWKDSEAASLHRGHTHAMRLVMKHPGCTQKELAEQLYVSEASVAATCKRLEDEGLLTRQVDPENRRRNRLYASQKGAEESRRQAEIFDRVDEITFKDLTEEELTALSSLLDKMMENLGGKGVDPHSLMTPRCEGGKGEK